MPGIDDLFRSGAPALKFPTIGTKYVGQITDLQVRQATDINQVPKTWADGSPQMELVVTLITDERDPANSEDDGERRLFCSGGKLVALRAAVKEAGAKQPEIGGKIAIAYTGDGKAEPGKNAPKQYQAAYQVPPAGGAGLTSMFDSGTTGGAPAGDAAGPVGVEPNDLAAMLGQA